MTSKERNAIWKRDKRMGRYIHRFIDGVEIRKSKEGYTLFANGESIGRTHTHLFDAQDEYPSTKCGKSPISAAAPAATPVAKGKVFEKSGCATDIVKQLV